MSSLDAPLLLPRLLRLLEIAAMLAALFFLLPLGVAYLENYDSYAFVRYLLVIDSQCTNFVRALVPIKLGDYDTARGICVLLAIAVSQVIRSLRRHFTPVIALDRSTDVPMFAKTHTTVSGVKSRAQLLEVIAEAKSRLDAMQRDNGHGGSAGVQTPAGLPGAAGIEERNRLLIVMTQAQSRLEEMERDLAFLSIDVVGSTKMKVGEDKIKIEADFRNYKKFIDKAITKGNALTSAWTPDGVMICFPSADAAVITAKSVLTGLQRFNKEVKTMRADFQVRCGVNSGRVYYDPAIPMEEMSDHVIDVAGHMQKYAAPDSVFLSKSVVNLLAPLPKEGFKPTNTKVDGFEAYQWSR